MPSACEKHDAVRIDIRQVPLGPMPGFPHSIPRCVVNIRIPSGRRFTPKELIEIAAEQRDRVLSFGKHYCAMAFHCWTPEQKPGQEEAAAVIDYAPGGKWEDAMDAGIGEYETHKFQVMSNLTEEG